MPSLVRLYNELKDAGFDLLAINVQEKRDVVQEYVHNAKLPFPVLLDSDGRVSSNYGIRAHPAHFLINRKGELIALAMGARDWASPEKLRFVRTLLEKETEGAARSIR